MTSRDPAYKLLQCRCTVAQLTRLRRPLWMRFVPFLRLCYCLNCGARIVTLPNPQWLPYFAATYSRRRSERPGQPQWEETRPMPRQRRAQRAH